MMTHEPTQRVRFLFDPACPWAWRTARWIREAARRRPIAIEWELLSLTELNRERMDADALGRAAERQPSLRLLVRAREQFGNDGIERLYATLGHAIHARRERAEDRATIETALREAELPLTLLDARDDERIDVIMQRTAREAMSRGAFGVPTLFFGDSDAPFFGPVIDPPPTGDEAARLWDHVAGLATMPAFFELKRPR
jgi:2-hydroxychromene-2-carboxylate isomerase